jgi:hypothetical protein
MRPSLKSILLGGATFLGLLLLTVGAAGAAIVMEQAVSADGTGSVTLPSIAGGSSQTYVLAISNRNPADVTMVSGAGLVWVEHEEQCSADGAMDARLWTAQGSPGSSFQVQVNTDNSKPIAAVLARFSGVGSAGSSSSQNFFGVNGACDDGPDTEYPALSLTSSESGSVHIIELNPRNKRVDSSSSGYSLAGTATAGDGGDMTKSFLYYRPYVGTATFQATLSGDTDWATAGLVLSPGAGGGDPPPPPPPPDDPPPPPPASSDLEIVYARLVDDNHDYTTDGPHLKLKLDNGTPGADIFLDGQDTGQNLDSSGYRNFYTEPYPTSDCTFTVSDGDATLTGTIEYCVDGNQGGGDPPPPPPPAGNSDLEVEYARLVDDDHDYTTDGPNLKLKLDNGIPDADIFVDGQDTGKSLDDEGYKKFYIEPYSTSDCTVTVSDGGATLTVSIDYCEDGNTGGGDPPPGDGGQRRHRHPRGLLHCPWDPLPAGKGNVGHRGLHRRQLARLLLR